MRKYFIEVFSFSVVPFAIMTAIDNSEAQTTAVVLVVGNRWLVIHQYLPFL